MKNGKLNYWKEVIKPDINVWIAIKNDQIVGTDTRSERYKMITIKLPKKEKEQIVSEFQRFFAEERSETIGNLEAEEMVHFMLKELTPYIYNQAIDDARNVLLDRVTSLEEELYALKKLKDRK
jgi:uncharacterized protein (DUF2164 family)